MRFIYEDNAGIDKFRYYDVWTWEIDNYTIEDTQDSIIWLINSQKSYEEMREYYVKG